MAQVDERVVAMSFETAKFDAGVTKTLAGLKQLSDSLNNINKLQGLDQLEKSSQKVTLSAPMSALDRLKQKLGMTTAGTTFSDIEKSAEQVKLNAPQSALDRLKAKLGFTKAGTTFSDMEKSADQVKLAGPQSALDKLKQKLGFTKAGATFSDIERDADRITLRSPMSALDKLKQKLGLAKGDTTFSDMERSADRVKLQAPQTALTAVQTKLGQTNAGSTFADMERSANQVTFSGLGTAITNITSHFSILEGAAAVALGNIASKAISAGANLAKAFTLGPITQGLGDYETQINAVQTILANTGLTGAKGLGQVNSALDELNHYADKTIYNFAQMAKNIGTFTAAGVNLETATSSIKGIANLAALSGSSSMQASTAMYQLSQAIAVGKVNLMDWKSVETAGMGGKVFQKALFDTAKAMGTLKDVPVGQTFDEWKKAGNSFRQSLSATQKGTSDATSEIAKAQKDGAEAVRNAQESAAESVQSAKDRVVDAQKRVVETHKSTAEAISAANDRVKEAETAVADTAERSAESIKNAKDRVKEAQKGVSDSAKQSRVDVQEALKAQAEAVKQSAENVKSALDGVTEAQKRLADALKPPSTDEMQAATDAVQSAQLDQADLATAVADAQTEQRRSAEDLTAAQAKLAELQKSGAGADEIRSAQRAVEDATRRATDASDAQERALLRQRAAARDVNEAQTALTETQKKGTEEDQNVKDSRDALTQALDRYKQAQDDARESAIAGEERVAQVRRDSAARQKEAAKTLIQAEKDVTEVRKQSVIDEKKAAKQLSDAEDAVVEARQNGAERAKEAAQAVVDAQKAEVKATQKAQEQIAKAHEQAAASIQAAKDKAKPDSGPTSWLTSDVLTNTLKQFTGDMTTAQLKAQGFTDEQIKAIQATGKVATESATKIKTLSQLTSTLKEEVGSAWSSIFETLFGSIDKSTTLFTGLDKALQKIFVAPVNDLGKLLVEWDKLGGRTDLFKGVTAAFDDLKAVFKPLKDAFREIFPPTTAQDLVTLTGHFRSLMESLKIGPDTADGLKRTFAGLFAVLDIGWTIVKRIVGVIADLIGTAGKGSGGILEFTGSIGDFLVKVDKAVKTGKGLDTFFDGLTAVLKVPIKLIGFLASAIAGLFGFDTSGGKGLEDSLQGISDKLGPLERVTDSVKRGFESLQGFLGGVKTALDPWFSQMSDQLSTVGDVISNAFKGLNYDDMMSGLQTGLLAGILLGIKRAFSNNAIVSFGKPFEGINKVLGGFTGQMQAMQSKLHAEALLAIAGAVVVLAAGIFLLSKIPADDLSKAMTAVTVGLAELMGAMKLMTTGIGKMGFLQLPAIAIALVGLATAVLILAAAMKIFATMSWEEIGKGMAGVAGSITAIALAMKLMPKNLPITAAGLILIGVALNLIAAAMKIFATMKWEEIVRGLFAVVEALGGIALGMSMMPKNLPITAAGLILVGVALNIIAAALKIFGSMDPVAMVKGLVGIGAALVTIALAVQLFPPTMPITAAGLILMGAALTVIAGAIALMGNLKLETLVKGIGAMGVALVVLAGGLSLMAGTLPGALGLMAAASALAILAPTLGYLGTLDIRTIIVGLAAMAATMIVIGLASEVAAPGLISLGIALLPLAGALLLASGAVYLFAKALSLVGDVGPKAVAVLIAALTAFVMALPDIVIQLLKGLLDIVGQIAVLAPKVVVALGVIIDTIIAFVIASAPKLAIAIGVLVDSIITVLVTNAPKIIAAGFQLLMDLLSGIANNIGQVVTLVASIVVNFLNALTANLPRIIAAGANLLVQFIAGITSKVASLVTAVAGYIIAFVTAVGDNIGKVASAGANLMVKFIAAIAGYAGKVISKGTEVIMDFLSGVASTVTKVIDKGIEIAGKLVTGIAKGLVKLAETGAQAIIDFLNGLAKVIREKGPEIRAAGWNVASAIIDGIWQGIHELGGKIVEKLGALIHLLPGAAKRILGIASPSSVFAEIGRNTMDGMVQGIAGSSGAVVSAATGTADDVVSAMKSSLQSVPDLVTGMIDVDPTITPVLDLSNVEQGAKKLGDLTNVVPITAAASFGQAAAISADQAAAAAAAVDPAVQAGNTFEFNQYNTSPKSLSEIEIYRQTNNQLAQLKSAVGLGR